MPKWTGQVLAAFPSVPPCPPARGLPHPHWTPNHGWVPLGVGTPPLPQPPLRGAGPVGLYFIFAPPSLPPTPSGLARLEGVSVGKGSSPGLSRLLGVQVGRGKLTTLPSDPLPSQWSLNFPLRVWNPLPSPSRPSGAPVPCHLHFSSPLTPPHAPCPTLSLRVPPNPLGIHCPPWVPGRCPSFVEMRILHPPSLPS